MWINQKAAPQLAVMCSPVGLICLYNSYKKQVNESLYSKLIVCFYDTVPEIARGKLRTGKRTARFQTADPSREF